MTRFFASLSCQLFQQRVTQERYEVGVEQDLFGVDAILGWKEHSFSLALDFLIVPLKIFIYKHIYRYMSNKKWTGLSNKVE